MRWCRNVWSVISYDIRIGTSQNIVFIIIQPLVERRWISHREHLNYSTGKRQLFKRSSVRVTSRSRTLVVKLSQKSGRRFCGFRNRRAHFLPLVCMHIHKCRDLVDPGRTCYKCNIRKPSNSKTSIFLTFLERYYTNINEHNVVTRDFLGFCFFFLYLDNTDLYGL